MTEYYARYCDKCKKGMNEGYVIGGGTEYYCSDECLHKDITPEEWDELYDDGEGDSYWTDWEEESYALDFINKLNKKEITWKSLSDADKDAVTEFMEQNDYAECMKCEIIFNTEDDGGSYLNQADYVCEDCIAKHLK